MQKAKLPVSALRDGDASKSAASALALACDWLKVGNMAEAAKWAAIAASRGEAEKRDQPE